MFPARSVPRASVLMRTFRFALVTLSAAALSAQQSADVKSQLRETASIQGQVVNAVTGDPLKKAAILLFRTGVQRESSYSTTSTAGGRFTIDDIEPGNYRMMVTRNGYARMQYGARRPGRQGATLSLYSGQQLRDIAVRLAPQAVVAGRVTDEDGDPVPHVNVQLLRYHYIRGKRLLVRSG